MIRLLRRPGNGQVGCRTELVVWRGLGQQATVTGTWHGAPTPVWSLAEHHPHPYAIHNSPPGTVREFPAGWVASSYLRPGDRARIERVAAKAPGYYSAKGRQIRGDEPLTEVRARNASRKQAYAERMCFARTGPWSKLCCRRDVVACDLYSKKGRCADHSAASAV